jgi:multiple sugar transport system ATP-binding protein
MAQVILNEVTKRYAGNADYTVKPTSLKIHDKEFLILVGPSGCGKSTTLRMVAGLEDVTSGEIIIGDRVVNDLPPKDRDIAMVFQNYALYPHMNVYDNLSFGLKLRGAPKEEIRKKVQEVAEQLQLDKLLERKPKALSGGQRQRVALGRAIVRHPQVFLMDEPLSNLDAKLRVQMRAELNKLHKRLQTTVIYVTHDQTEAMTMGSRIVVFEGGYVQQIDSPQQIYDHPGNRFVAGFIGSPSMNFITCRLERGNLVAPGVQVRPPEKALQGLMSFEGCDLELGIRPEDILPANGEKEGVLDTVVEVIEPMGSENFLYLRVNENTLVSRMPPTVQTAYGQSLKVRFNTEKMHVFNKKDGKTIV